MQHEQPTPSGPLALGPATEEFLQLTAEYERALHDVRRSSRWPWVRKTAERRFWALGDALARWRISSLRDTLIDEAIARAKFVTSTDEAAWRRPSIQSVADELRIVDDHIGATHSTVLDSLFPEGCLRLDAREEELALETAIAMGPEAFRRATSLTGFIERPYRRGGRAPDPSALELAEFITSEDCRLARPVTVWRGERPFSGNSHLSSETMLRAPVGSIIERPPGALSATFDPAVAARIEFSGTPCAASLAEPGGWVLEIRTDHVFYAGARNDVLGFADRLAEDEREALVVVPRLRINSRREARIDAQNCDKRAIIVECSLV